MSSTGLIPGLLISNYWQEKGRVMKKDIKTNLGVIQESIQWADKYEADPKGQLLCL